MGVAGAAQRRFFLQFASSPSPAVCSIAILGFEWSVARGLSRPFAAWRPGGEERPELWRGSKLEINPEETLFSRSGEEDYLQISFQRIIGPAFDAGRTEKGTWTHLNGHGFLRPRTRR
jgi:hypothetical protein